MNRNVLIVDDDIKLLESYRRILAPREDHISELEAVFTESGTGRTQKVNFHIQTATQGQDGFHLAKEAIEKDDPFAVTFIDMRMPAGWNGLETAKALRELDDRIYIVIVSAYEDQSFDEKQEALKRDVLLLRKKPFISEEIYQLARNLCNSWDRDEKLKKYSKNLEEMLTQKTAELAETYKLSENIVTSMTDVLFVLETDDTIKTVNPAATTLLIYTENELIGMPVGKLFEKPAFDKSTAERPDGQGADFGEEEVLRDIERILVTKDGRHISALVSKSIMRDETGVIQGAVLVAKDITKRKKTEVKLEKQFAEQTTLLEATRAVSETLELEKALHRVLEQLCKSVNVTSAYIYEWNKEDQTENVIAEYICSASNGKENGSNLRVAHGLRMELPGNSRALLSGEVDIFHVDDPKLHEWDRNRMKAYGYKSALMLPMKVKGEVTSYAALFESRRRRTFTEDEISLAQAIAQQAANVLENNQLYTELLQRSNDLELSNIAISKILADMKKKEKQIEAGLIEKEVLLQEIHHRVKNNMEVISSLLQLQSNQVKDKKFMKLVEDSQHRIHSMSLIHEKLYQSEDLASIDFEDYIQSLVEDLFQSQGIDTNNIALRLDVGSVFLGVDSAVPCGLIINELISNCLKYAFPQNSRGKKKIEIALKGTTDDEFELVVSDNGIGIPQKVDFRNTESLGLRLVTNLTERQLQGSIELDRSGGTRFHIKFKNGNHRETI